MRRGIRGGAALVALVALGGACISPPRVSHRAGLVHVRADDERLAREIAEDAEPLLRRVRALLGARRATPIELWVQDGLPFYPDGDHDHVLGYTLRDEQHAFVRNPDGDADAWRDTLVHELTHLAVDGVWADEIGFALEEALCMNVARELVSAREPRYRPEYDWWLALFRPSRFGAGFDLDLRLGDRELGGEITHSFLRVDIQLDGDSEAIAFEKLAFVRDDPGNRALGVGARTLAASIMARVIEVHGWATCLRLLRERTGDDAAWRRRWLAHAGLGPDAETWSAALLTRLDRRRIAYELVAENATTPETCARAALSLSGMMRLTLREQPDPRLEDWLRATRPRLVQPDLGLESELGEHPVCVRALGHVWAAPADAPPDLRALIDALEAWESQG